MAYLVHVSCLSTTTVSQLFEPQLQKVVIFTYPGLHFLFALGTPLWQSRKTLHEWKDLPNPSQHVPVYIQQFPSYSNRKCKKSPFSRTAAHIFVSAGDVPAIITQYVACMERQFSACQTPRSMYLPIFNSFRVIRCLSQCIIPKSLFLSHFGFPWGRPWDYHAVCCMDGKKIQCLPNTSQHVPIYLQYSELYDA